ncbi:acyl carrier protein [Citreicella sp. C3M06]|uniref:acyl carrier protein n=1 Tax=Roseobacteraceae TaxID=2854170 RepID=UPI001C0A1C8B|nr:MULTISPECIES: acyl carrier protein [Roseobacteraceae]MBU2963592.1 acyl carrier protein [Citreicella sp. C3M06]MDO6587889.1 acyl carrier protein [Salipiger sp. 1_MG-2023]
MTLTLEKMRADVAAALDLPVEEVPSDEHLGDLGLDSIALMRLLMGWEELQPTLPSEKLYECETLAAFWDIARAAQ